MQNKYDIGPFIETENKYDIGKYIKPDAQPSLENIQENLPGQNPFLTRMPTQQEIFENRLGGLEPWQYVGGTEQQPKSQFLTKEPTKTEKIIKQLQGLDEWEYVGGNIQERPDLPSEDAGVVKTLDMMNTATHRAISRYTLGMMSALPFGKKYQQAIKQTDEAIEKEYQKNKIQYPDSYASTVGELYGDMLATLPIGGVIGKSFTKAASLASGESIAPVLGKALRKTGKYSEHLAPVGQFGRYIQQNALPGMLQRPAALGLGTATSAGAIGLTEAAKYQGQPFDIEDAAQTFKDTALSPGTLLMGAGMTGLGIWGNRAARLREAQKDIPGIMNRQLDVPENFPETMPPAQTRIKDIMFSSIPNLTQFGKLPNTIKGIGPVIYNYINKLSGHLAARYSGDYKEIAGKELQKSLDNLVSKNDDMWKQLPLKQNIGNSREIANDIWDAFNVMSGVEKSIPALSKYKDEIMKTLGIKIKNPRAKKPTVVFTDKQLNIDDAKNLQSKIGTIINKIDNTADTSMLTDTMYQLNGIKNRILNRIENNLGTDDLKKQFQATRKNTAMLHKTLGISPKIKKALFDEVDARNVIKNIMSEAEAFNKAKVLGIMSEKGEKAILAARLAKVIDEAGDGKGGVNIGSIIDQWGPQTNIRQIAGTETYKAISGFNRLLRGLEQSSEHKMPMWIAGIAAPAAAGQGLISGVLSPALLGGAALTYNALAFLSNRSPIKKILAKLGDDTKKLSPSLHNYLSEKAHSLLFRAGFFVNNQGQIDKDKK